MTYEVYLKGSRTDMRETGNVNPPSFKNPENITT